MIEFARSVSSVFGPRAIFSKRYLFLLDAARRDAVANVAHPGTNSRIYRSFTCSLARKREKKSTFAIMNASS